MVEKKKLPLLPESPEKESGRGHFPSWLHRTMPKGPLLSQTRATLDQYRLATVCEEARCPNQMHCWSQKTATFLALGKACTRACGFCEIDFDKSPKPPEPDEPLRIAQSAKSLGLQHIVITMVARDDLVDGGAKEIEAIVLKVREINPGATIELLTSDFEGQQKALDQIIAIRPEIFNHNIETVRKLTPRIRHKATYERTLSVLNYMHTKGLRVKSGFMVGLGEEKEEVYETLQDLAKAGVSIVTIGQYLQPSRRKLLVKKFIHPDLFAEYARYGESIGIKQVYAGPLIRSSFNAKKLYEELL